MTLRFLITGQTLRPLCLRFGLPALALFLSGCAQYATIAEKKPLFRPEGNASAEASAVNQGIANALKVEHRDPLGALGGYLAVVQSSAEQLQRNPQDESARRTYNFALSRVFSTIRTGNIDPWTKPLTVPSAGGDFVLTHRPDKRKKWNPALYDLKPADQFDVRGTYVQEHTLKEGVGATLVATGKEKNTDSREDFSLDRTYYGVTAVAQFNGRRCTIGFEDPLATETISLNGRTFPLAADFTVPVAVMLASTNPKKLELARALAPEKYAETARISRLQPYDPNKTVVLFIHGLVDSPATWAPMINHLRGDESIRKHYQFWFYSYPSGYPYPYSASILREQLDAVEKKFPLRKKMVVVGHSMGGCISRLLLTDADQKLWLGYFGKPPAEVHLSPETKRMYESSMIFHHRPEVGRVIFISAPLKGSDMASNWFGRFASSLVKAPVTLLKAGGEAVQVARTGGDYLKLKRIPNSVDTLAPNNWFVKNVNAIPVTSGIPYNTIMGDRGRGDAPNSSDGVVPYWSSHMDGAQSELIVPSSHSAHQNPKAIAEVRRILDAQASR